MQPETRPSMIRTWLTRIAFAPLGLAVGWLLGTVGGWIVWETIYGIGDRVITDDLYVELQDDVVLWSMVAGAVSGAIVGGACRYHSIVVLFMQHAFGVAAGCAMAHLGWRIGLAGYCVGQLAGIGAYYVWFYRSLEVR